MDVAQIEELLSNIFSQARAEMVKEALSTLFAQLSSQPSLDVAEILEATRVMGLGSKRLS